MLRVLLFALFGFAAAHNHTCFGRHSEELNDWCAASCSNDPVFCPQELCQCPGQPGLSSNCTGVPPFTGATAEAWCNLNCNMDPPFCPPSHCACDVAAVEPVPILRNDLTCCQEDSFKLFFANNSQILVSDSRSGDDHRVCYELNFGQIASIVSDDTFLYMADRIQGKLYRAPVDCSGPVETLTNYVVDGHIDQPTAVVIGDGGLYVSATVGVYSVMFDANNNVVNVERVEGFDEVEQHIRDIIISPNGRFIWYVYRDSIIAKYDNELDVTTNFLEIHEHRIPDIGGITINSCGLYFSATDSNQVWFCPELDDSSTCSLYCVEDPEVDNFSCMNINNPVGVSTGCCCDIYVTNPGNGCLVRFANLGPELVGPGFVGPFVPDVITCELNHPQSVHLHNVAREGTCTSLCADTPAPSRSASASPSRSQSESSTSSISESASRSESSTSSLSLSSTSSLSESSTSSISESSTSSRSESSSSSRSESSTSSRSESSTSSRSESSTSSRSQSSTSSVSESSSSSRSESSTSSRSESSTSSPSESSTSSRSESSTSSMSESATSSKSESSSSSISESSSSSISESSTSSISESSTSSRSESSSSSRSESSSSSRSESSTSSRSESSTSSRSESSSSSKSPSSSMSPSPSASPTPSVTALLARLVPGVNLQVSGGATASAVLVGTANMKLIICSVGTPIFLCFPSADNAFEIPINHLDIVDQDGPATRVERFPPFLSALSKPGNNFNLIPGAVFFPPCMYHTTLVHKVPSGAAVDCATSPNLSCLSSGTGAPRRTGAVGCDGSESTIPADDARTRARQGIQESADALSLSFDATVVGNVPDDLFQDATTTICDDDVVGEFSVSLTNLASFAPIQVTIVSQPRFDTAQRCSSTDPSIDVAPRVCFDANDYFDTLFADPVTNSSRVFGDADGFICVDEFLITANDDMTNGLFTPAGFEATDSVLKLLVGDIVDTSFSVSGRASGCPEGWPAALCATSVHRKCHVDECA